MNVLLVGVGGVGEAFAVMVKDKPWIEQCVLTDYDLKRCEFVQGKLGDKKRYPIDFIDASDQEKN